MYSQCQHEFEILQVLNVFAVAALYDFRRFTHVGITSVKEFRVFCCSDFRILSSECYLFLWCIYQD